jgi:hypothetical protein
MTQLKSQRNVSPNHSRVAQQMLHEISQTILESSDSNALMDQILEKTLENGGFDIGMIRLFNSYIECPGAGIQPRVSRSRKYRTGAQTLRRRLEAVSYCPRL